MRPDQIEDRVCAKILGRAAIGLPKYKITLTDADKSNLLVWADHAQKESMDHANYLEKLMDVLENLTCPHCKERIVLALHEQPIGAQDPTAGPGDANPGALSPV